MNNLTISLLEDLGSARGAKAKEVSYEILREILPEDLKSLASAKPQASANAMPGGNVARLRTSHHKLAQAIAQGMKGAALSLATGYSASRISVLRGSPAFNDLIEFYTEKNDAIFIDAQERLAALGMSAVDEIQERLDEDHEKFTIGQLLEIAEFSLDRSLTSDANPKNGGGANNSHKITVEFVAPKAAQPNIIDLEIEKDSEAK